ncbi:hypothetical protein AVEN_8874-1 [Araneus ventricosus]|uniref:Uncharacterized protein n=1 Tax=Araneus ventricosus TaxID=182803 RepID=A0A4Y2HEU2_ARAVE|nr:hypothetical protein AVEN_8874-1 [Araneus ventricosus]
MFFSPLTVIINDLACVNYARDKIFFSPLIVFDFKAVHSQLLRFGISGANGLELLEFQRTQNPTLHPPIPIWNLDARLGTKQRICLHWDLASRLEMKLEIPYVEKED